VQREDKRTLKLDGRNGHEGVNVIGEPNQVRAIDAVQAAEAGNVIAKNLPVLFRQVSIADITLRRLSASRSPEDLATVARQVMKS
jgi:hypothetical protein